MLGGLVDLVSDSTGGLIDFGLGQVSASQQRKFARAEAQKQRDWMQEMSSTAHQRQVKDMREAGLNPVLSATGGSGAQSGSGAQAHTPESSASGVASAAAARAAAAQAAKTAQETKYIKERTREAKAEADYKAATKGLAGWVDPSSPESLGSTALDAFRRAFHSPASKETGGFLNRAMDSVQRHAERTGDNVRSSARSARERLRQWGGAGEEIQWARDPVTGEMVPVFNITGSNRRSIPPMPRSRNRSKK